MISLPCMRKVQTSFENPVLSRENIISLKETNIMALLGFFLWVGVFLVGNWLSGRGNKYTRATERNCRLQLKGIISEEERIRRNREIMKQMRGF